MENMTTPAVYHDATGDEEHERFFKFVDIMSAVIYSLVCVLGVLGNGISMRAYLLLADEERDDRDNAKEVRTVWFLNLAVADFLATAFLPLNITQRARDNQWPFGWFMCKMDGVVFYMNMYASIYILVLISVDRCVSLVWPIFWSFHRHRSVRLASLGVWVMSLALSIPHVISRELDHGLCYDYPEPSLVITNLVVGFVFPFFVIVSCNSVIFYKARSISLSTLSSVKKVLAAVIVVFFLCWAPFHIIRLLQVVDVRTLGVALEYAVPISLTVAYLNICLNPLVYMLSGGALRRCGDILKALEKVFAEDQPDNAPEDLELKGVILPTE